MVEVYNMYGVSESELLCDVTRSKRYLDKLVLVTAKLMCKCLPPFPAVELPTAERRDGGVVIASLNGLFVATDCVRCMCEYIICDMCES